jgi:hypothetical protein
MDQLTKELLWKQCNELAEEVVQLRKQLNDRAQQTPDTPTSGRVTQEVYHFLEEIVRVEPDKLSDLKSLWIQTVKLKASECLLSLRTAPQAPVEKP